jgi:hypothetical protein
MTSRGKTRLGSGDLCKPNCKRTTPHRTVPGVKGRHRHGKIGELEHTLSYWAARTSTRILELENRCTGNVGSNPTLSARRPEKHNNIKGNRLVTHKLTHNGLRSGRRKTVGLFKRTDPSL